MVDPLLLPFLLTVGRLAEGITVELSVKFMDRQRKFNRFAGLSKRKARRLLGGAAEDVAEVLHRELGDDLDHEWRAALAAVHDSLAVVTPLELTDALVVGLRQENLTRYVLERSDDVRRTAALSEVGQAAYDRILAATCGQVLRSLLRLPGFERYVQLQTHVDVHHQTRMLREQGQVLREIRDHHRSEAATHDLFERRYLDHVVGALGHLELFGVSRGRVPHTHSFEDAYVSLAVARSGHRPLREDDDEDELTGAGVEVRSGLTDHKRVLLRGDAGAGKTTLLRWLAASSCGDLSPGDAWGQMIPFFVALRDFADGALPAPDELPQTIAHVITGEMPPGWATAQFNAGRALLLVDGVDELRPERRKEVRTWLQHLASAYPDVRVVVSARPFAISEDWLDASGFVTFDLLPLSPEGIESFLDVWHGAARDEHSSDPDMQDWLDECRRRLGKLVEERVELRRLASNPLLCGLLCALHQERDMHLPRDRKGLYDAALELLLVRWDESRELPLADDPSLSEEEQTVLLQRFAYSMVKKHELVVARPEAAERLKEAMRGLRSHEREVEPKARRKREDEVLQHILVRTGLLREPSPEQVQFVHRTFRDHLAAKEIVDSRQLPFLVAHAHLDHWHDVVVNVVAHARPDEREWVLRALLNGNEAAQQSPRLRSRLQLVAAACLAHADVLDTDEARRMVQEAAERLIPPASLDEAEMLAKAGSFVLDLLPGPKDLTAHQAACVIRTTAMIGGEGVREKLTEFVPIGESMVVDELLRAWRRWRDPESYARTVLAGVDFGERRVEVRGWRRVECLRHLTRLTNVVCYGDFADLAPLALVPRLSRLELVQNELVRQLDPLAASRTLRALVLTTGCQFLRDLSPLAGTTIDDLSLHLIKADLGTLRGVGLRRLAIRDPRLDDGLDPLPGDLPLRELVIDNLPRRRNLRGVERWLQLEHVSVKGVPRPDELSALAQLPALRRLTIWEPEAAEDLARLEVLPHLRLVDIRDPKAEQVADLASVLRDRPDVEVRVDGQPVAGGDRLAS